MNQTVSSIQNELTNFCYEYNIEFECFFNDEKLSLSFTKVKKELVISNNNYTGSNTVSFTFYEYQKCPQIVKSKILALNKKLIKIFARNTKIQRLEKQDVEHFFNKNHVLGYCNGYYKFGLFNNNTLVMAALFSKARVMHDEVVPYRSFELIRVCSIVNHVVVGGLSKLINHFVLNYHAKHIMTYVDITKDDGNAYIKLGFIDAGNIGSNKKLILNIYHFG
ncbi:MAG: hypothetical protein ACK4K9_06640 [Bacteroidia bacterium]